MERARRAARCSSSTSACPATSTRASAQVFGVTLLDIDDLRAFGEQSLAQRRQEIGHVREIITEELDRFRIERTAREVAPIVTALRARVEDVRAAELERHRSKLDALDPAARDAVEQLTRSIVNKLLHEPTVRLKDAAGTAPRRALRRRRSSSCSACSTTPIPTPIADALMPRPLPRRDAWQRAGAVAGRPGRHAARAATPSW